jgi:hypothetical protein
MTLIALGALGSDASEGSRHVDRDAAAEVLQFLRLAAWCGSAVGAVTSCLECL